MDERVQNQLPLRAANRHQAPKPKRRRSLQAAIIPRLVRGVHMGPQSKFVLVAHEEADFADRRLAGDGLFGYTRRDTFS